MSQTSPRIAVIGAGMAGLTCAGGLAEAGVDVVVFEKSRGSGGRMSSRRSDGVSFDIGAQYFTARDEAFRDQVLRWSERGWVERWDARVGAIDGALAPTSGTTERYVGVPRMSALTRNLVGDLDVRFGARVAAVVETSGDGWTVRLEDGGEQRGFDAVVCTAPAPQTAAIVRDAAPTLAARIQDIAYSPTWAVSLRFDEPRWTSVGRRSDAAHPSLEGSPTPPSSLEGAPTPPRSWGGAPTPPSSWGGAPTPPRSWGGAPTPPAFHETPYDAIFVEHGPIDWIARDGSKPVVTPRPGSSTPAANGPPNTSNQSPTPSSTDSPRSSPRCRKNTSTRHCRSLPTPRPTVGATRGWSTRSRSTAAPCPAVFMSQATGS